MKKPTILVTGATGKTGTPLVHQLLESGYSVRAVARVHDDRSAALAASGAEVVLGDFHDLASMRSLMKGVKRVSFCYPPQEDRLLEATAIIGIAAREAGVEVLVNVSQLPAREDAVSPLTRHHWLSELMLDLADVGATHVRPTYFAEMLLLFGAQSIAAEGKLYMPYGDRSHAPISATDIARVMAALLTGDGEHAGERLDLTGPRELTLAEMASVIGDELGRPVEYMDVPPDAWGEAIRNVPGVTDSLVAHLKAVAVDHRAGVFSRQTDEVERLTGRPPESLPDFVKRHRDLFAGQPRPVVA
jgi:NAD(P)H dehydrogenase (quinone)